MRPQRLDPRPYFAHRPDPRRETRNKLHKLQDILMIVLGAVLSGVEDWVGMADFAEEKEAWRRGFLELPNGIPSHDTLSDVLGRIDPVAFQAAFTAWATAALPGLGRRAGRRRWPGDPRPSGRGDSGGASGERLCRSGALGAGPAGGRREDQ
jgi:hypothetical protein